MKQITIRGIPIEVERVIRQESKRKRLSLNKAIVSLLEKSAGIEKKEAKKVVYHDLDNLSGKWSVAEAKEFEKYLHEQRHIDEELWT